MKQLFATSYQLIERTSTEFVRYLYNEIRWGNRLIAITGARGSGKTTLMLQYIKEHYTAYSNEALYASLDNIWFFRHSLLELADEFHKMGGKTLFLDEVGNLNMETQVQLLRALQEKRYKLVGGTEEMHADVRLLAATNEDLEQAISEGRFREDLFHRLNEFPLHVPPLIDCREDIIPLAGFFLSFANEELEKKIRGFDRDVREAFVSYPWPGNIRELKNVVRRACVLAQGGWITLKEISLPVNVPPSNNYRLDMERTEQEAIQKALETTGNDRKAAARLLGISRSTLYLKLKKYGLI